MFTGGVDSGSWRAAAADAADGADGADGVVDGTVTGSVASVVEVLLGFDPLCADRAGLELAVERCARVRAWVDSIEVGIARRTRQLADPPPDGGDGGEGAPGQQNLAGKGAGEIDATDLLGNRGRRDRRTARASARRSAICDRYPRFEQALAHGEITAAHLDVISQAFRHLTDAERSVFDTRADELLDIAISETLHVFKLSVAQVVASINPPETAAERLERQRDNSKISRWHDQITGMYHLHAVLDPESGAKVFTALDAHLASVRQQQEHATLRFNRLEALSFTRLLTSAAGNGLDQRIPEICVHIDLAALTDDVAGLAELADATLLPIDTIRRLCCDANIHPMFMSGTHCLAHGRNVRTATREQRRALRAMYRTCGIPNCDVPFQRCEMHHVKPWITAGLTDLDNLLPICSQHHHQVHEGRWHLTMTPTRVVTYSSPDHHHTLTADTTNRTAPTHHATPGAPGAPGTRPPP